MRAPALSAWKEGYHRCQSTDRISIGLRSLHPVSVGGKRRESTSSPNPLFARVKKTAKKAHGPREKGGKRERSSCVASREEKSRASTTEPPPSIASRFDDHAANYLTSSSPLTNQSSLERKDGRETQRRRTLVGPAGRRSRARAHHSPVDGAKPCLFALRLTSQRLSSLDLIAFAFV